MPQQNQQFRKLSSLIIILLCTVIVSCATTGTTNTPLTPKQQATIWMDIYNAQYDDTVYLMSTDNPFNKIIGAKKKEILTQVWPLLKAYVSTVENNGVPTEELTTNILNLINQLTPIVGAKH